jgi:hypothetical protein
MKSTALRSAHAITLVASLTVLLAGCGGADQVSGDLGSGGATNLGGGGGAGGAGGAGGHLSSSSSYVGAGGGFETTSSAQSSGSGMDCTMNGAGCDSAQQLEGIDGDQNSDQRVEHGSGSAYYTVYVKEASNWISDVKCKVVLEVPQGEDYSLNIYKGTKDSPMCGGSGAIAGKGIPLTASITVSDVWFNNDDSYYVSIEVLHNSSSHCDGEWTLTVTGNAS